MEPAEVLNSGRVGSLWREGWAQAVLREGSGRVRTEGEA